MIDLKLPNLKIPRPGILVPLGFIILLSLGAFIFLKQRADFSRAKLYVADKKVTANFRIARKDGESFKEFLKALGINEEIKEDVSVTLDDVTTGKLKDFLPRDMSLKISGKTLEFSSSSFSFLETLGIINSESEFLQSAQSGGSLKINDLGGGKFEVEIDNPAEVINSATSSGKLKISGEAKDSGLWQSLTKLAKIKLKVDSTSLWGVITLH